MRCKATRILVTLLAITTALPFFEGTLTYQGTMLSDRVQEKLLLEVLTQAGLGGPDQQLAAPVRVRHGMGNRGRNLHYYMNDSSSGQNFTYPCAGGNDLLTGKPIEKSASVPLAPGNW
jgi:beta-galactosidase